MRTKNQSRLFVALLALGLVTSACSGSSPTSPSPNPGPVQEPPSGGSTGNSFTVMSAEGEIPLAGVGVNVVGGPSGRTDSNGRVEFPGFAFTSTTKLEFVDVGDSLPSTQYASASGIFRILGPLGGIPLEFIRSYRFGASEQLMEPLNRTIVVYFGDTDPRLPQLIANFEQTCAKMVADLEFIRTCRVTTSRPAPTEGTIQTILFGGLVDLPLTHPFQPGITGNSTVTKLDSAYVDRLAVEPTAPFRLILERGVLGLNVHSYNGMAGIFTSRNPPLEFSPWEKKVAQLYSLRSAGTTCFPDLVC